jgi:hypothetical protein
MDSVAFSAKINQKKPRKGQAASTAVAKKDDPILNSEDGSQNSEYAFFSAQTDVST